MDFNTQVKLAIYHHFAETGRTPPVPAIAERIGASVDAVQQSYSDLQAARVLFLEPDGRTIRMAPPFSGVPTQHLVEAAGRSYYANCAWDTLGIPAALHLPAVVRSECAETHEPLSLEVGLDGPAACSWIFHSLVPAARWWQDLVHT
ncbi:MAG TPA: organomercurial lyase [Gemmatimonadales bacterium]|nr:organomercurial lyase [Gemmatimonadales bacterium]